MEAADEDAEIIFGTVIDDTAGDNLKVTVIATGLGIERAVAAPTKPIIEPIKYSTNKEIIPEIIEKPVATPVVAQVEAVIEQPTVVTQQSAEVQPPAAQKPSLYASLQEAATHYQKKMENERAPQVKTEVETQPVQQEKKDNSGRVRAIAERLGFISFDEEELDTPTFMRKDDKSAQKPLEI
jgi:cell division protein FtsZ